MNRHECSYCCMSIDIINVVLITPNARVPERKSDGAAGYDLFAADDIIVQARGRTLVPTGISIEIPRGYYGRVAPRSGLALNFGLDVGAGVIDSDYRGPVGVLLFNHSDAPYKVECGARIAQIIIETIITPEIRAISQHECATERGTGGFGSTGMK